MKLRVIVSAFILFALIPHTQAASLIDRTPLDSYVNDSAGIFTPSEVAELEMFLESFTQSTAAEITVVVIPSLENEDLDSFTSVLFERWRLGKTIKNRSVMIFTSINDREIRIEVGHDLKPLFPDTRIDRIMIEHIIPQFRTGRVAAGLTDGAQAIAQIIASDAGTSISLINGRETREITTRRIPTPLYLSVAGLVVLLAILGVCAGRMKKQKADR